MTNIREARRASDDDLTAWALRHDLGGHSLTDLRCMFEDAASAALSAAPPAELGALITLPDGCAVHAMHIAEISLNREAAVVTVRTVGGVGHPITLHSAGASTDKAARSETPATMALAIADLSDACGDGPARPALATVCAELSRLRALLADAAHRAAVTEERRPNVSNELLEDLEQLPAVATAAAPTGRCPKGGWCVRQPCSEQCTAAAPTTEWSPGEHLVAAAAPVQDLIERLRAASRDERLSTGMLYREAAEALQAAQAEIARLESEKCDAITWVMLKQRAERAEATVRAADARVVGLTAQRDGMAKRIDGMAELMSNRLGREVSMDDGWTAVLARVVELEKDAARVAPLLARVYHIVDDWNRPSQALMPHPLTALVAAARAKVTLPEEGIGRVR